MLLTNDFTILFGFWVFAMSVGLDTQDTVHHPNVCEWQVGSTERKEDEG